jgi:S-DNA-T family DNA segregation ATPase FtsK/SpoIIIE
MWMFLAFTAVSAISVLVPFFSSRRQRRRLKEAISAALKEDEERRRRSAPSAADLALRNISSGLCGPSMPANSQAIWLRVGLSTQTSNIRLDPADPDFQAPPLEAVPLRIQPTSPATTLCGPEVAVAGLVRTIIMQLVGLPLARNTRVLVHGTAQVLPLAARFVGNVSLVADSQACRDLLDAGPGPGCGHGVFIVMNDVQELGETASLASAAERLGWQVIRCVTANGATDDEVRGPLIDLTGPLARLTTGTDSAWFIPDLVPEPVFDRYCRRVATHPNREDLVVQQIPDACSLGEVLPLSDTELSRRWSEAASASRLAVPLGIGVSGPRILDLQADGPHLLVAGTTGSGKSELLRTLTAALALTYSPDSVNFLFVDFKGGSGLGPLRLLPHCAGMLTDLSRYELDRFLVSLRAEIRYRERLLAEAEAPDLGAYRSTKAAKDKALPHLVLMIDEFRMLVEEAPEALSELMRIAVIGRSLGLHLVMATQRPQGALTADIRANVTTSIALRVQSDSESADILNSSDAARIPITTPGRAFLARGTEVPQEFQTASLTQAVAEMLGPGVVIQPAIDALTLELTTDGWDVAATAPLTPAEAAAPIVRQASSLWAAMGGMGIRHPVAPPLPELIPFPPPVRSEAHNSTDGQPMGTPGNVLAHGAAQPADGGLELGWVDLPEQQLVIPLTWEPNQDGHLGFIGTMTGGMDDAVILVVRQVLADYVERHIYVLDADNTFSTWAGLTRVGAVAGLQELRRGARVLERIAGEMAIRLSSREAAEEPPLVLVVSGWGSWVAAFRASPLAWAEDLLHDIIRDGARVGISVLISGERELVTARFFSAIPNRVYFPCGASEDSRLAWPRLPAVSSVPGRAVAFGALVNGPPSVAQFFELPKGQPHGQANIAVPANRPFRIEPLPSRITVSEVRSRLRPGEIVTEGNAVDGGFQGGHRRLLVGVGGDELDPVWVPIPGGSVLAVLGGPSSGKTSLMDALPHLNPHVHEWRRADRDTDPNSYWSRVAAEAASGALSPHAVVLLDDADRQSPDINRSLLDLNELGLTIVLTTAFSHGLMQRIPLMVQGRRHGAGILISPRSILDGDFFGVRFEVEAHPGPGRALVISEGKASPVQLAVVE